MQTLEGIRSLLQKKTKNEIVFKTINTRLVLRTGVNLLAIRDDQSMDLECLERVRSALSELGYEVSR